MNKYWEILKITKINRCCVPRKRVIEEWNINKMLSERDRCKWCEYIAGSFGQTNVSPANSEIKLSKMSKYKAMEWF